jgi:hypothetical protein
VFESESVSSETDESVNQLHPWIVRLWMEHECIRFNNVVGYWYMLQNESRRIVELHEKSFRSHMLRLTMRCWAERRRSHHDMRVGGGPLRIDGEASWTG